jgi:hypothetical protein
MSTHASAPETSLEGASPVRRKTAEERIAQLRAIGKQVDDRLRADRHVSQTFAATVIDDPAQQSLRMLVEAVTAQTKALSRAEEERLRLLQALEAEWEDRRSGGGSRSAPTSLVGMELALKQAIEITKRDMYHFDRRTVWGALAVLASSIVMNFLSTLAICFYLIQIWASR